MVRRDRRLPAFFHTLLVVVVIGLLTGFLTSRGQTYLPNPLNQFANSYSVWLAVSFLVGVLLSDRTTALIGGFLVQVFALFGYYFTSLVLLAAPPGSLGLILFWAIGGATGGPILSLGGYWWHTRRDQYALIGSALLGAIFVSEGLYVLTILMYSIGWAFVALGIIASLATTRQIQKLLPTLGLLTVFSVGMYVVLTYGFGWLYSIATG